jgi:hypothetical protein
MNRAWAIELACLYGPLMAAGLLAWWVRPSARLPTGLLFSLAWTAALLPWLDAIARAAGLWQFHCQPFSLAEMPLSLYFGWVIAWGAIAPLLAHALGRWIWLGTAIMLGL